MSVNQGRFYGKYRGRVVDNEDPGKLGRIRARVPSVTGNHTTGWCLPASPYAGNHVGFIFLPPLGANVWIEFEEGNLDYPIWTGGFWDVGESIGVIYNSKHKIIRTESAFIHIQDTEGSEMINIKGKSGKEIVL